VGLAGQGGCCSSAPCAAFDVSRTSRGALVVGRAVGPLVVLVDRLLGLLESLELVAPDTALLQVAEP